MSINKELVSAHSSTWVGIQYFLLSVFLIYFVSGILTAIGLAINPNIFGFFFWDDWQMIRLATTATFFGVLLTSILLRRKITQAYNPKKAVLTSSTLFCLLLVFSLLFGAVYYEDPTPHDAVSFVNDILVYFLFSVVLIIEYPFLNWLFFRKYFAETAIPIVTHSTSLIESTLFWEISADARRGQIKKFIVYAGYLFVGLVFVVPFVSTNTIVEIKLWGVDQFMSRLMYSGIGVTVALVTLYFINKAYPHKNRTYTLEESGITVSIGNKTKMFEWSEFACFYQYSKRQQGFASQTPIVEIQNEIEGSILYLQKKSGILFGIGKIFVIIRTTPENQDTVIQTLRMKLEEKQMTTTTDLGLVLYECK